MTPNVHKMQHAPAVTVRSWMPTSASTGHEPPVARDQKYRLCKFCGFWQYVGEEPKRLIHYLCKHGDGSFYPDWKEPRESWCCPDCGTEYAPDESVPWADEDPLHPFRTQEEAPKDGTQADFRAYWGRFGLEKPWGIF